MRGHKIESNLQNEIFVKLAFLAKFDIFAKVNISCGLICLRRLKIIKQSGEGGEGDL
jgi:hypothetical protein